MTIAERVRICRLIEKIQTQDAYSKKIGVRDASTYRGKRTKRST